MPDTSRDERDLIRRCRQGDELAWAWVYREHSPRVARFLRRMLGPDNAVDDLVQVVFVELFSTLDRFRGDAKLSTWLYGIARNVAGKHIRTESRHRRRVDALAASQQEPRRVSSVHGAAEARAELEALESVLATLDDKHRAVWVMREVEELSTEEVAEALDLPPGTVRSRLFNARKKVLAGLERRRRPRRGLRIVSVSQVLLGGAR